MTTPPEDRLCNCHHENPVESVANLYGEGLGFLGSRCRMCGAEVIEWSITASKAHEDAVNEGRKREIREGGGL